MRMTKNGIEQCSAAVLAVLLLLVSASGAHAAREVLNVVAQGDTLFIAGTGVMLKYDLLSGRFNVVRGQGEMLAHQAYSEAVLSVTGASPRTLTLGADSRLSWYKEDVSDALGKGRRVVVTRRLEKPKVELIQTITTYETAAGMLVSLKVRNRGTRGLIVEALRPFVAGPPTGGLFVGLSPAGAEISGAPCADTAAQPKMPGGALSGAGCWYVAVQDPLAKRGLVAGFVTQTAADVHMEYTFEPGAAQREPEGDRLGFTQFRGNCGYAPAHRLAAGESLASETMALIPAWDSVRGELDELARMAAAYTSARPLKRAVLAAQLQGADLVLKEGNLAARADALAAASSPPDMIFLAPGLDTSRMPGGLTAAAAALRSRGFGAGLVWRPFHIAADSPLAQKHPEWLLDNPAKHEALLDISRPEVQQYIADMAARMIADWGFSALVLEDTQAVLGANGFFHKGLSRQEMYRAMLARVRTAAGAEAVIVVRGAPPLLAAGVAHALHPALGADAIEQYAHGRLWAVERGPGLCETGDCKDADFGAQLLRAALSSGVLALTPDQFARLPVWGDTPLGALMIYPLAFRGADAAQGVIKGQIPERPWALLSTAAAPQGVCASAGFSPSDACHAYNALGGVYLDGPDSAFSGSAPGLFVVRPEAPAPQLLFSNSSLAALDRDVASDYWDAVALTLNGAMDVRAGFNHHLVFYAPLAFQITGKIFESDVVDPAGVKILRQGSIMHMRFTPSAAGDIKWAIKFSDTEAPAPESNTPVAPEIH
jgi:hypothetical protein